MRKPAKKKARIEPNGRDRATKKPVLPKWAMRAYHREYYAVGLEFSNVAVVGEEVFGGGE